MILKDKVCIITNSGKGIGSLAALKFASEGAKVVVCDIVPPAIENTLAKIRETGGNATGCRLDVTKKAQINDMVEYAIQRYGRVDILVNNAGILQDNLLDNMTQNDINRAFEAGSKGAFLCTKALIEVMVAQKSGVILNVLPAKKVYNGLQQIDSFAYDAISLAETWVQEYGNKGIRLNAVVLGFMEKEVLNCTPYSIFSGYSKEDISGEA